MAKEIFARYEHEGHTNVVAQCYDLDGKKAVLIRFYTASGGAPIQAGADLSAEGARKLAANLIACADELEKINEPA